MTGIDVTIYNKTLTGYDAFNDPVYAETPEIVHNVLVGEPSTDDISQAESLFGRKLVYMLGIPKGDAHNWTDVRVGFFGRVFRTFGLPMQGIAQNVPTPWNMKVRCEHYE